MGLIANPVNLASAVTELARRVENIERGIRPVNRPEPSPADIVFSHAGPVATSTSPKAVTRGGTLTSVIVTLGTAGSSSTVVTVYKNGSSIGTVTLASSATIGRGSMVQSFAPDIDKLHVAITTAGTGAADLVAMARIA